MRLICPGRRRASRRTSRGDIGVFPTSKTPGPHPSGLPSPRAHFVGLAPLPHPSGVGCADSQAVTRVSLQIHQLDGGAQDLIEDPWVILCLGHLTIIFPDHLLQQDLVETDPLLAWGVGPGNLGEENPRAFLRPGLAWPPLTTPPPLTTWVRRPHSHPCSCWS